MDAQRVHWEEVERTGSSLRETAGLISSCTPGPGRIDAIFLSVLPGQFRRHASPYSALGSCRPCARDQKRDALIAVPRDHGAVPGAFTLTILHRHRRRGFAACLFRGNTRCGSGGRHRDGSIARVQPDRRRRRGLLLGRLSSSPARNRRAPSYSLTAHRILTRWAAAFRTCFEGERQPQNGSRQRHVDQNADSTDVHPAIPFFMNSCSKLTQATLSGTTTAHSRGCLPVPSGTLQGVPKDAAKC